MAEVTHFLRRVAQKGSFLQFTLGEPKHVYLYHLSSKMSN